MKKQYSTIAVDLDDVVVMTGELVMRHYSERWGITVDPRDYYTHDHKRVWGVDDVDEATRRINSYMRTPEYSSPIPVAEAVSIIKRLKKKYKLYIVTGRPDFLEKATDDWMDKHFPGVFEDVIFTNFYQPDRSRHKGDVCLELGANLLIDDHWDHILSASNSGVDSFLFGEHPWSKAPKKLPANVKKVKSWREVGELLL